MQSRIQKEFNEHIATSKLTLEKISGSLEKASLMCINCLHEGGKIILFGNGGSAADAQHIAAELVGRYKNERKALSAISLSTDTSTLTSIGNDYGYDVVFERQVNALANINDVIIGISTGGKSINVIKGIVAAKKIGCKTIGFSGRDGGEFNSICNLNIIVPASETARIQEMHILIGHIICQLIDLEFTSTT
jgi:D-sedoheptulose 7-phosphate isomerase